LVWRLLEVRLRASLERDPIALNPFAGLKASSAPRPLDWVLTLSDLRAWQGAAAIGFPFGSASQLLVLTAERLDEVSGMR
jgi:hypothetical protein